MIVADWRQLTTKRRRLRAEGKNLVFTNGCFDLLHPGHIQSLEAARALGDALVVAINTDRSVRANKGAGRPVINQEERAELLDALEAVDYITFFDEPTPRDLIAALVPDVLVKGADWGEGEVVGEREVVAAGGRVVRIPLAAGYSTTNLINRARKLRRA
ncbi:MAG TPA: D-glycero-beta-D-manno-heptose 1-phosphate adenylyltransferase [Terriglobales bacterium]